MAIRKIGGYLILLRQKTENYLYFQTTKGTGGEPKRITFNSVENILDKLKSIEELGINSENNIFYLNPISNKEKIVSGIYNITINILTSGKPNLYNIGNVEIQTVDKETLKLIVPKTA